jgi:Tfp pilus assembly protein PilX
MMVMVVVMMMVMVVMTIMTMIMTVVMFHVLKLSGCKIRKIASPADDNLRAGMVFYLFQEY